MANNNLQRFHPTFLQLGLYFNVLEGKVNLETEQLPVICQLNKRLAR